MRSFSFIFAFATLFLGPALADHPIERKLPGIGTFAFENGLALDAGQPILMAELR